jgi:hypothetical protein
MTCGHGPGGGAGGGGGDRRLNAASRSGGSGSGGGGRGGQSDGEGAPNPTSSIARQAERAIENIFGPPDAGRARSEGVNSISNLGAGFDLRNQRTLASMRPGDGFSGVYDPTTSRLSSYRSVDDPKAPGAPVNAVPRLGGHGDINDAVFSGSRDTVAFVGVLHRDGSIEVRWNSFSVNVRNFGNRAAPRRYRWRSWTSSPR